MDGDGSMDGGMEHGQRVGSLGDWKYEGGNGEKDVT